MDYTVDQIKNIVTEAKAEAKAAATEFLNTRYQGRDVGACGFAWVNIWGIKGSTKLGKAMKAAGLEKDYSGAYCIWNPSGLGVQNIDTKEVGARAAAEVFKKYGFEAYAGSRMD